MDGIVEGRAKGVRKAVDERFAAAAMSVLIGLPRRVTLHAGEETAARHVIGQQQSRDRKPRTGDISFQLPVIIKETGRLDDDGLPFLFNDEHLVCEKVVGPVSVELHAAEIIKVYFALRESNFFKTVFVHIGFLLIISESLARAGA